MILKITKFFLVLCMGAWWQYSYADIGKSLSLNELIERANYIVYAKCDKVESFWRNNKVFTGYGFSLIDSIKNDVQYINIETIGGTALHPLLKTKISTNVPGSVNFKLSDKVILFLNKNEENGQLNVVGGSQGVFRVKVDEKGNKSVVTFVKKAKLDIKNSKAELLHESIKLDEFILKIKKIINN
ncbi:hypothetical protein ACQ96U_10280 [Zooshikella sp. RANM57]